MPESAAPEAVVAKLWDQLSRTELYDLLALRANVFLIEQKVDEEEMDGRDDEPETRHYWIADARGCASYLRVLWNATPEHRDAHRVIGRVATRADRRGEGLALALLRRVIADYPGESLLLHSQEYVVGLYERVGFAAFGDVYDEAGIPHRSMYRGV